MSLLDECWEWKGARQWGTTGYGRKRFRGQQRYVHRIAYEWVNGPIPKGMEVLHSCDNPPCANPRHLRLGTHLENMEDCTSKKRFGNSSKTVCKRGHSLAEAKIRVQKLKNGRTWTLRVCLACARRKKEREQGDSMARRMEVLP